VEWLSATSVWPRFYRGVFGSWVSWPLRIVYNATQAGGKVRREIRGGRPTVDYDAERGDGTNPVAGQARSAEMRGAGEKCGREARCRPNGLEVHLRGQGPRGYGSAAHGVHACESRDAGRAPPFSF
jgi:hypothetical protein